MWPSQAWAAARNALLRENLAVEKSAEGFGVVDRRVSGTVEYYRVVAHGFFRIMDAPSPAAGKIAQIVVKVGDKVSMGALIARVDSGASEGPIDVTIPAPPVFKDVLVGEILVKEGDTVQAGQPVMTLKCDARQKAKEYIVWERSGKPRHCEREGCAKPLGAKRRSKRFCSDACKQAHYRQEAEKKRDAGVTLKSGDTPSP
jgi:hypothetical protein